MCKCDTLCSGEKDLGGIFMRKTLSILLSIIMALSLLAYIPCTAFAAAADAIGKYDFKITNPYETVDWDTWKAYKGATHVHTVRSDGNVELNDMIEEYYAKGYQALALTDHGTVSYSWTEDQTRLSIFGYQYFVHGNIDEISEARYQQITTGSDRGGDGMTEIPLGIELNGSSSAKCHVNSYFADCGHGDLEVNSTWPEDAIKKSQNAGGICHINHVGEWTEGKSDINTYNADFVAKYANLFLNYSACIGMELVNTTDNRTHNDRYLYDETLKVTAPLGRNIWGFCEDDAHDYSDVENNAQYFVMPENNAANIRTSMENGTFFACSKNAKTAAELGDGFAAEGAFPMISRVAVDDEANQISVNPYNAQTVKMVADGKVIAEKSVSYDNQTITFDLNEYEDEIGSYVRIYVLGKGGICYAQPFLVEKTDYKTSTVQFILPSEDTTVTVKDSDGNVVEACNSDHYYKLGAGSYTYTAERSGFETKTASFSITQESVNAGLQIKINVELKADIGVVSTTFYVPETIYLNPSNNTFQYYLDRENAIDGALNSNASKTTGNVYFNCDKATAVSVTVSGATVSYANGSSATGGTLSTAVSSGKLNTALASGTGTTIEWTASYTLENGEARTAKAYSYVYAPNTNEVGAAMRQVHTYSTDVYNQGILYAIGFESVTGGSYTCTKNFFTDSAPTSNTGIGGWFTSAANGGVEYSNHSHKSNAGDSHTVTGGTGTVYVDSSRVTNLNQIPNLKIGYWQCDAEGDTTVDGYIKQTIDGATTTVKSFTTGVGSVYSNGINYANKLGAEGTKKITISAYSLNLRGNRKNNNYYNISINANYVNKETLRTAYNAAIRSAYDPADYSTSVYSTYSTALMNAGTVLGDPTATASEVSAAYATLANATGAMA